MQKLLLILLGFLVIGFFGLQGCGNNRNYPGRMHRNMMQDGMMNRGQDGGGRGGMMGTPGDTNRRQVPGRSGSGTGYPGDRTGTGFQVTSLPAARQLAAKYLRSLGNPDLSLGDGSEETGAYEFPVRNGTSEEPVAVLVVNKKTGAVQSKR